MPFPPFSSAASNLAPYAMKNETLADPLNILGGTLLNPTVSVPTIKSNMSLAAVASSGLYTDLTGKPTLAAIATTGAYADLTGKPALATVATSGLYTDLSSTPNLLLYPSWQKVTVPFTAIQIAALTNTVLTITLPSQGVVHNCFRSLTTAFAGSGIVTLTMTVGTAASNAKYMASATLLSGGTTAGVTIGSPVPESYSAATSINMYVTAVGANLSALTQGSVDLYFLTSKLP